MSQALVWNFVASIQHTLDEAAGLNAPTPTVVLPEEGTELVASVVDDHDDDQRHAHRLVSSTESTVEHTHDAAGDRVGSSDRNETSSDENDEAAAEADDTHCEDERHSDSSAGGGGGQLVDPLLACDVSPGSGVPFQAPMTATPPPDAAQAPSFVQEPPGEGSVREQQLESLVYSLQQRIDQWKPMLATIDALKLEGQSLSHELGAERERWKLAVHERKAAVAKLDASQEQLNALKAKETRWMETHTTLQDANQVLKERVAILEATMIRHSDDLRIAGEAKADAEERYRALAARLAETHDESVAQQERDALLHQSELDRLQEALLQERQAHRQAVLDYEHQHVALQRDLAATEARAHAAESRLLDSDGTASAGMHELVLQCRRAEESIAALQKQLAGKQEQIVSLTRAQSEADAAAAEASLRLEQRIRAAAADRKLLEAEHSKTTAALTKAQLRCDELLRSHEDMRARSEALDHELSMLRKQPQRLAKVEDGRTSQQPASVSGASADKNSQEYPVENYDEASNIVSLLRQQPTASSPLNAPSQHQQQRLEREIARLTKEVRRLKSIEQASARIQSQLDALVPQHDMLLQMYGQLEEQLEDARSDARQIKSVYQRQLDLMAKELEKMSFVAPRSNGGRGIDGDDAGIVHEVLVARNKTDTA
jgi:DNA repair exonuclease SbcCD ATPase subunit